MLRFLISILLAGPGLACSCFHMDTPCSVLGGGSAVFVAEVIEDSGAGLGSGPARVKIVEVLQNVPKGLQEAVIETMAGTSCYRRLQAGKRYVIITRPERFDVSGCSSSFELAGKEHILAAMKRSLAGAGPGLVGSVSKRVGLYSHGSGVGGAEVELRKGELSYSVITGADGSYAIDGIEPGRYQFRVRKGGYVPDDEFNNGWTGEWRRNEATGVLEPFREAPGEIEIPAKTCRIRRLAMWPEGSIRGNVRGVDGRALAGVSVQAFGFDAKGRRESSPLRTASTDSAGNYRIELLPSGKYVVGVNARTYHDDNPYPPTLYAGGKAVQLSESGTVLGVDLVVPPARLAALLRIQVLDEEGRPYSGAAVRLESLTGVERWISRELTDHRGEIVAPVYVGERYQVKASRYGAGLQGVAEVDVVAQESRVNVVLREEAQGRK